MTYLRLGLLGPMQVVLNDQPIDAFPYEKVRALFAYLAIESSYPHHREHLAALFWADQCEAKARSNLRKALSTLRQMLGDTTAHSPLFLTTRNTIQLNPAGAYAVDVTILTQLLDRYLPQFEPANELANELCSECISGLEQAVALYRGTFLEQILLPDSETFETWIALNRQRLHDLVINAYAKLAAHYEHQQDYQKAQQHIQRQLQLEPWNEPAHRCLMRILVQQGRRTKALQQYARCCELLEQQLATKPEPATTALWEAIRSDRFSSSTHVDMEQVKRLPNLAMPRDSASETNTNLLSRHPDPIPLLIRQSGMTKVAYRLRRRPSYALKIELKWLKKLSSMVAPNCFSPWGNVSTAVSVTLVKQYIESRIRN